MTIHEYSQYYPGTLEKTRTLEKKIFTVVFTDVPTMLTWLNERPASRGIECALDSTTTSGGAWRTWITWEYEEEEEE